MKDGSSKACYDCETVFTVFRRKHHCQSTLAVRIRLLSWLTSIFRVQVVFVARSSALAGLLFTLNFRLLEPKLTYLLV